MILAMKIFSRPRKATRRLDLKTVVADLLDVRTDHDTFQTKIELVKQQLRLDQGRPSKAEPSP
jgi:hypothetical protein